MQRPLSTLKPRSPARSHGLASVALLVLWCFVLWGTLLDLGALWMLVSAGPSRAWESLQALSPTNALTAVLAVLVWSTVAWMAMGGIEVDEG